MIKQNYHWDFSGFSVDGSVMSSTFHICQQIVVANIDLANWYNSKQFLLNCNLFQCKVRFESFIIEYFCLLSFELLSSRLDTNMRMLGFIVGIVRYGTRLHFSLIWFLKQYLYHWIHKSYQWVTYNSNCFKFILRTDICLSIRKFVV